MAKIRIKSALAVWDTEVWIDDQKINGITSIKYTRTTDKDSEPLVEIIFYADDLVIEGEVGEVICE